MMKAILFDLDGTLIDRDAAGAQWFERVLRDRPELLRGMELQHAMERFRILDARGYTDRSRFCEQVVAAFSGIAQSPEHFWRAFSLGLAREVKAQPSVLRLLEVLRARFVVAILTNGSVQNQQAKIEAAGLTGTRAFFSETIGCEKPRRDAFLHVTSALRLDPHHCLFVGDDPERDILGAKNAGLKNCWISHGRPWPHASGHPDVVVSRIEDVEHVMELRS